MVSSATERLNGIITVFLFEIFPFPLMERILHGQNLLGIDQSLILQIYCCNRTAAETECESVLDTLLLSLQTRLRLGAV